MKRTLTTLASAFVLVVGLAAWTALDTFEFGPESKLVLSGTSTMHDWSCEVADLDGSWTAELAPQSEDQPVVSVTDASVVIPVDAIDCGNGTMTKRLRKAIDSDDHEMIRYNLTNAEVTQASGVGGFALLTEGVLEITGTEQPHKMTIMGQRLDDGTLQLTGETELTMSDFGVKPPSYMLGALRVGDQVNIKFDVNVPAQPDTASN